MKKIFLSALIGLVSLSLWSQGLTLPASGFNLKSSVSQRVGTTDIDIHYNAPGVKGREGKIWGTAIVHFGFIDQGFGSSKAAPWRAGANENTTIEFSSEVTVEGKTLAAGKYGFHIAVYSDSCTLIFSKNNSAWGSYFYNANEDALRVTVRQEKNRPENREWLSYEFSNQTENSTVVALVWERWRIPFKVTVDVPKVTVAGLRKELQTDIGFHADSWINAANYCLTADYNLEEAISWVDQAPQFGPVSYNNFYTKAQLQEKLGRSAEAEKTMQDAMGIATVLELHTYGRQLLAKKKPEKAMEIFQLNFKKNGDTWPTHVGLMRGYSATGDLKKALEHAKIAQKQAPDDVNKQNLEAAVKLLSQGKPLN